MKMKGLFLTVIFAFLSLHTSWSQAPSNLVITQIDSIKQLLTAETNEDTVKIKRLNELARMCFYTFQYTEGLIATKQAHQLSSKLNYRKGEGLYLRTMSVFHNHSFEDFWIRTKWFYNDFKEKEDLSDSDFYYHNRNFEKENPALFDALKYFEAEQDKETIANILQAIASNYSNINQVDKAMPYVERALTLFKGIGRNVPYFYMLVIKIYGLEKAGKKEEAKISEIEANVIIAQNSDVREKALLTDAMSQKYLAQERTALGVEYAIKTVDALEIIGEKEMRRQLLNSLQNQFEFLGLPKKALEFYKKEVVLRTELNDFKNIENLYNLIAFRLIDLKEFDEAKSYLEKAKNLSEKEDNKYGIAQYNDATGQILLTQGKYQEALPYFLKAIAIFETLENYNYSYFVNLSVAKCHQKMGNLTESLRYAKKGFEKVSSMKAKWLVAKSSLLLSEIYDEMNQPLEAYKYLKIYQGIAKQKEEQDIANRLADMEIQSVIKKSESEKEQFEKDKSLKEKENRNQRLWLISVAGALLSAVVLMFLLYRNNRHKQKANAFLQEQKEKVENTLSQLKATQTQLVQSEKLASLGELTAGIAHEIQNPLNFVNNFSEISVDLAKELKEEIDKIEIPEKDKDYIGELLTDLSQNQEKINHHGKRASSIVRGMLEHSRASTGVKALTDINKLADEYLRLSYHGLRAKNKDFNADFSTDFEGNLPKIEVIPQDMGRVLLNLINNAFYAVNERAKQLRSGSFQSYPNVKSSESYIPSVSVTTQQVDNQIIIKITDNGTGIPESVISKVFQPFFTTKPTGSGTGLGLSLAYEIVTKGHGGTLEIETKEGEFTTFIIKLP
jgi:two-component system, NtrC family, sensor kinase